MPDTYPADRCPLDPDNFWIDAAGGRIDASSGERTQCTWALVTVCGAQPDDPDTLPECEAFRGPFEAIDRFRALLADAGHDAETIEEAAEALQNGGDTRHTLDELRAVLVIVPKART